MNWLTLVVLGAIVVFAVFSYRKGFADMILTLLAVVVAVLLTWFTASAVKTVIVEKTSVKDKIADKIETLMTKDGTEEEGEPDVEDKLDVLNLPDFLKKMIVSHVEGAEAKADRKIHTAAEKVADLVLTAAVYLTLFIINWIIVRALFHLLEKVMKLPGLKQLDGLAGMAVGLVEILVILDLFFLFVTAIAATELGTNLMGQITDSKILSFLYEKNILLSLLKSVMNKGESAIV